MALRSIRPSVFAHETLGASLKFSAAEEIVRDRAGDGRGKRRIAIYGGVINN